MKHKKYNRIEGLWHQKTVKYFQDRGFFDEDIEWCVTEKVHGSNFAFYLDQEHMLVAKRANFIEDGENFFQYHRMAEKDAFKCQQIWDDLATSGLDLKTLIIYGELFGGHYPHDDIQNFGNVRRIQKGVYYHPDIKFYAFDIWMDTDSFEGYLDYDFAVEVFEKNKLFYAKILDSGTFEEMSKHSDKFQTCIPKWLGLPDIDDNICEGIVLKPILPLCLENGDRVILKSKNERFKEKSREGKPEFRKAKTDVYSQDVMECIADVSRYINENRLRNVLSKHGEFTKKDFGRVLEMFRMDILVDFLMEKRWYDVLSNEEWRIVNKNIGRLAVEVWRPIFLRESL